MADDTVACWTLSASTLPRVGVIARRSDRSAYRRRTTPTVCSACRSTRAGSPRAGYTAYSLGLLKRFLDLGGVDFYYEATLPLLFSARFMSREFDRLMAVRAT